MRLARDEQALREALARRAAEITSGPPSADGAAVSSAIPMNVFVSYARRDTRQITQLLPHLNRLEREGQIQHWADHLIREGHEWEEAIRKALASADLILLLVSANFLDSDFIRRVELPITHERNRAGKSRVIWVRLTAEKPSKANEIESWISALQATPRRKPISKFNPRENGWIEVRNALEQAAADFQSQRGKARSGRVP